MTGQNPTFDSTAPVDRGTGAVRNDDAPTCGSEPQTLPTLPLSERPHATSIRRRRTVLCGGAIFIGSLLLRLALLMEVKDHPTIAQVPVLDMRGNHEFALAILKGLRPTTYYKAPLYSYFLAGVYAIGGPDPFIGRVVQIVLTSLTPVLIFLVGQRLFGFAVGLIGGVVSTFYWTFLYYSVELLDAGLACLFSMLLAHILVTWRDDRWSKWLVGGFVLGLGAITRPNILAAAPVLAIVVLASGFHRRRGLVSFLTNHDALAGRTWKSVGHAALLAVGCCAAVLPVTLRNRIVGGDWELIGAYGGMNFHVANNPYSDSKSGPLLVDESAFIQPSTFDPNETWGRCCLNYELAYRYAESRLGRAPTPGEFSKLLFREGLDFIRSHPTWFARHAVMRLCWLFNTFEYPSNRNLYDFRESSCVLSVTSLLPFGVVSPLALVGLVMALGRSDLRTRGMACYIALIASLIGSAVFFIINCRFRQPLVHLLMPFAAYGFVQVIRLCHPRTSWRKRVGVGGALAGLALFSNLNLFGYWAVQKSFLKSATLAACEMTGRTDLLPRAVEEFEQALADDIGDERNIPHLRSGNTGLLLRHSQPFTWLFRYYTDRQPNEQKALKYARLALEYGRLDLESAKKALALFTQVNQPDTVRRMLTVMNGQLTGKDRAVVAAAMLEFARRYNDRKVLAEAGRAYRRLAAECPSELEFHRQAEAIGEWLAGLATTRATSAPTTTSP